MNFLALSQAPPALAIMTASTKPVAMELANRAPVKGRQRRQHRADDGQQEGTIMAFCAPRVEMATQVA
jgi:hypothetical protein